MFITIYNYLLLFSISSLSLIVIKKRQFTIILYMPQGANPLPLSPLVSNKHQARLISASAHHKSQIKNKFSSLRNSTDYTVSAKTIQSIYYPATRSDTIRYRTVSWTIINAIICTLIQHDQIILSLCHSFRHSYDLFPTDHHVQPSWRSRCPSRRLPTNLSSRWIVTLTARLSWWLRCYPGASRRHVTRLWSCW